MRALGVAIFLYAGFVQFLLAEANTKFTFWWIANVIISTIGILAALGLCFGYRKALPAALAFAGLFLLEGVCLFIVRVWFIIENGGMDRKDGFGSPVAFMIGWVFEITVITFPSLVLTLLLLKIWRMNRCPKQRAIA